MTTRSATARRKPRRLKAKTAQEAMAELRAERGALSRIAEALGLTPQAVHQWSIVPLDRVIEVERATGISRRQLRPDYHGVPSTSRT
jgi:DNA-binding transcriptional regulator YdaS (Cro superfamily)